MTKKYVDGKKYRQYIKDNNLNSSEVCRKAGIHYSYGTNSTGLATNGGQNNKCNVNEIYWNLICDALGVPRDYFDVKDEPKPKPVKEEPEEKPECLIDLADIQLSLNKIEALLLEQNRLLRGKIEKGEKINDTKGSTNTGSSHNYTVSSVRNLV